MKNDRTTARVRNLIEFCGEHGLKMITGAGLIRHRMAHERYLPRKGTAVVPNESGGFSMIASGSDLDWESHVALLHSDIGCSEKPVLVRMNRHSLAGDAFRATTCECRANIRSAMRCIRAFGSALALGFDEFTFQLKSKPLHMDYADAVRLELAVRHRKRAWQTIDIDLGPAGQRGERTSSRWACASLTPVLCLNLNDQAEQKLSACTRPFSEGRARDVLDILLIDLFGRLNMADVPAATSQLFAEGTTHAVLPAVRIPTEWGPELEGLVNCSSLGS